MRDHVYIHLRVSCACIYDVGVVCFLFDVQGSKYPTTTLGKSPFIIDYNYFYDISIVDYSVGMKCYEMTCKLHCSS